MSKLLSILVIGRVQDSPVVLHMMYYYHYIIVTVMLHEGLRKNTISGYQKSQFQVPWVFLTIPKHSHLILFSVQKVNNGQVRQKLVRYPPAEVKMQEQPHTWPRR